jgi:hypothetical protein
MKNVLTVGVLMAFMTLGIVGSAFAEDSHDKSILGTDQFSFNAPETKADVVAKNYVYNQQRLEQVGTEAGNAQFDFDAPETKAELATKNYDYDSQKLRMVGTEAGYDAYSHSQGIYCSLC